ncbi:MAG: hypothetical protein JSS34_06135 [Proteobacteria bacterium]|nr:hypothetical protein [Pseudomonadota bacterium]
MLRVRDTSSSVQGDEQADGMFSKFRSMSVDHAYSPATSYNPKGKSAYGERSKISFRGGRGGHKETRQEYAERRRRIDEEKLEKTRKYAESLGITGVNHMTADTLKREIQDKKDQKRRQREQKEYEELQDLRKKARSLGVFMAEFGDAPTLRKAIQSKEHQKRLEEKEREGKEFIRSLFESDRYESNSSRSFSSGTKRASSSSSRPLPPGTYEVFTSGQRPGKRHFVTPAGSPSCSSRDWPEG